MCLDDQLIFTFVIVLLALACLLVSAFVLTVRYLGKRNAARETFESESSPDSKAAPN
jgi:hypothetical protein